MQYVHICEEVGVTSTILRANMERSIEVHNRLMDACLQALTAAADALIAAYRTGHKALFFGNGGSAADAQHLAARNLWAGICVSAVHCRRWPSIRTRQP